MYRTQLATSTVAALVQLVQLALIVGMLPGWECDRTPAGRSEPNSFENSPEEILWYPLGLLQGPGKGHSFSRSIGALQMS